MNWNDDPDIQLALQESRVRRGLWINTIIWMPFFLLGLGLFIFFFIDVVFDLGRGGTVFLLVVLGILTTLFGFQGLQSVFDLFGKPKELSGWITRSWARSDSFVIKSHYIRVAKNIFRVDKLLHGDVDAGDYVKVRYYPHSAVVIALDKVPPPEGEEAPILPEPRGRDKGRDRDRDRGRDRRL